ncbi:hypothetical protein QWJ34_06875 [Saccharibacillus sp. CPCC 101409]|uniref:hypothetical protein n=1 Tax=Saccharibacillus sp. CPCC 101409 TaxID=3058041 RepID=UPI00267140B8|nr:hypothetical protein [Saccharibacillus sp. CPCC 101409]MDO3409481.1 hypothetical protein [Saccharibacillus sp. CPCC 101409]
MKRIHSSSRSKTDRSRAPFSSDIGASFNSEIRDALTPERAAALPLAHVAPLIREMDEPAKRRMAQVLEFPFVRRGARKWPEALFTKSLLDLVAYARGSRDARSKLAAALLQEVLPICEKAQIAESAGEEAGGETENAGTESGKSGKTALSPERYDREPDTWIRRYGKWHIYWALYFYPASENEPVNEAADAERLERLASLPWEERPAGGHGRDEVPNPEASDTDTGGPEIDKAAELRRIDKLNRRIEALESRCRAEEERGRRLDKEVDEARRAAAKSERLADETRRELEAERSRAALESAEREAALGRLAEAKRLHKQERGRLEAETAEAREAARGLERELERLRVRAEDARSRGTGEDGAQPGAGDARAQAGGAGSEAAVRADGARPEADSEPAAGGSRGEADSGPGRSAEAAISEFAALLRRDLRETGAGLPGEAEPGDLESRTHLRRALDLLDAVDAYAAGRRLLRGGPEASPLAAAAAPPRREPAEGGGEPSEPAGFAGGGAVDDGVPAERAGSERAGEGDMAQALDLYDHPGGASGDAGQAGTFYRRDHGGYIVLDGGETFNITESMVYKLQLQHEAEVWCTPREDGQGAQYEIELLFQGDDTFSPVRQYNGYVEMDEHQTWYAVDMNDPDRRYPIHAKDLDIQRPADGAPCIFNVGEEESVARLARVYRDFSDPESVLRRDPALKPRTGAGAAKAKREARKSKPEPFLEGCTVVVMGGQRKWFEDVVVESGAVYVHENGERPDLVASDLRRAQALFLLITSTSHRASWESIELAKASRIPYFIIQGSKSNLRSMLWENREAIGAANRDETG